MPKPVAAYGSSTVAPPGTCLVHGSFVGSACPTCSTGGNLPVQPRIVTGAKVGQRKPLGSVGMVCLCGKALATIEGVARLCECGRTWLVTAMLLGGDGD